MNYYACVSVCLHVCVHRSQLQCIVKVGFYWILALFSGLSTHSLTSPIDMDRHSQVAMSDCYHWLQHTHTHTPCFPCLSFSLFLSHPPHPSSSSSFPVFPQHLAVLSRGLVSGSASQASPLLVILHQPWSKRRTGIHLIRTPPHPPTTTTTYPTPRIAVQGEHGRGGLHTPKWL